MKAKSRENSSISFLPLKSKQALKGFMEVPPPEKKTDRKKKEKKVG
jgi:hypothetical protein